jgi:hypothetical protein
MAVPKGLKREKMGTSEDWICQSLLKMTAEVAGV